MKLKTVLHNGIGVLYLPLTLVWCEWLLAWKTGFAEGTFRTLGAVLTALAFGFALTLVCSLFAIAGEKRSVRKEKRPSRLGGWIAFAFAELLTVFFIIEYYCNDAFTAYMSPASILTGAGGIAAEYGDIIAGIITGGAGTILLFEAPALLGLVLLLFRRMTFPHSADFFVYAFIAVCLFQGAGIASLTETELLQEKYTYDYTYDDSVRVFGLLTATRLSIQYGWFGAPEAPVLPDFPDGGPETDPTDRYRGLFEGKNLVLITAESFSKELLNYPSLYPTLCRMASNGIQVTDYYHPFWGGSTTSGEAAILLGLLPTEGADSMQSVISRENPDTLAARLGEIGYSTVAYHNGTIDYYNRIETHPALGYDRFMAKGNGMEKYVSGDWPGSDREMFRYTTDELLESVSIGRAVSGTYTPFHAYYMTYSGHGLYFFSGHKIAARHKAEVASVGGSEQLRAYLAGNIDFEQGLSYMVQRFAEEGILDDTVFVIAADHYPYALQKGEAWKNTEDHLLELYGYGAYTQEARDHNALIIWSPCLEDLEEPIVVDEPTYAPDILPTLLYLFGLDYDPSVYAGRNIFSNEEPIVIWINSSWKTAIGSYNSTTGKFTPSENAIVPLEAAADADGRNTDTAAENAGISDSSVRNDTGAFPSFRGILYASAAGPSSFTSRSVSTPGSLPFLLAELSSGNGDVLFGSDSSTASGESKPAEEENASVVPDGDPGNTSGNGDDPSGSSTAADPLTSSGNEFVGSGNGDAPSGNSTTTDPVVSSGNGDLPILPGSDAEGSSGNGDDPSGSGNSTITDPVMSSDSEFIGSDNGDLSASGNEILSSGNGDPSGSGSASGSGKTPGGKPSSGSKPSDSDPSSDSDSSETVPTRPMTQEELDAYVQTIKEIVRRKLAYSREYFRP